MTLLQESDLSSATSDARVAERAAEQCGVISRAQALACDVSESGVKRRVRAGRWEMRHPGVYVIAGGAASWRQDLWCAVLAVGPGSVVTHESALRLHGINLLPRRPLTLTIPHGRHARVLGATVHQIDDLLRSRVMTLYGLEVSTPERTVVDLAATRRQREHGRVADELVSANKTSYGKISAALAEIARPRKPGVTKLARVLDERGPGHVPPQSELEHALFGLLAVAGLPPPVRQFPLPGRGCLPGLVDGAYVEAKVILEADGRRWHSRIADLKRDRERDVEAARVGWLTLRFLYEHIVHQPQEVVAAVAEVLASRGYEAMGAGPRPLLPRNTSGDGSHHCSAQQSGVRSSHGLDNVKWRTGEGSDG